MTNKLDELIDKMVLALINELDHSGIDSDFCAGVEAVVRLITLRSAIDDYYC